MEAGRPAPPRFASPRQIRMTATPEATLLELGPGAFVPAALPIPGDDPRPAPADAAGMVGHVLAASATARGRMAWGRAETHAREAADLAPRAGVRALAAAALNELAAIRLCQGSAEGVAEFALRAMELAGDGPERSRALLNLAVAEGIGGSAPLARIEEAAAALAAEDRWGHQLVRLNRAAALLLAEDLAGAADAAADALRAGRRDRDEPSTAHASLVVACVSRARGARNEARTRLTEAVRAFARAGDRLRQIQCHYLLGELAYEGEDPIRAGSHYRNGLAIAREAGATAAIELLTLRFEHR